MDAGLRTDDLEQARHDVDLHVELPQLANRSQQLFVVRVGEGDDHALDVEHRDDLGETLGRPEERQVLELGPARTRMCVDEADEVDAVLRVLQELPCGELADVAGADDDRVLEVERTAPRGRAGDAARRRHEDDGEQPEEDQPRHVWAREAAEPRADEERPGAERDELEDTDDLVDGRMIDMLLVAVVQPIELGSDDPQRQTQHHDAELKPGMRPAAARHDQLREQIGEDQAGCVRDEQGAPHEPPAPPRRMLVRDRAPTLEQRDGPPVEDERLEVEPRRRGLLEVAHAL